MQITKSQKLTHYLNGKLSGFNPLIFASIGDATGIIRIQSNDQGAIIAACWNLMADLDYYLMDLTDCDITDIKVHLHCNQYDPCGNEFFSFTINFTIE